MRDELRQARSQAYRWLAYRWYTQKEIEEKLLNKGYSHDVVKTLLNELEENKYVDDQRFTENWIEARAEGKLLGKKRLKQELKIKGIEGQTIEKNIEIYFSPEKELELALQAAKKKAFQAGTIEKNKFVRRLNSYLQRKGFDYQTIKRVIAILEEEGRED